MDRIPSSPPPVPPVPSGVERPLWTVAVPCYNSIAFLPHALQSVLSQDPGASHMQILVVDDHSTDGDVEALVKSLSEKYNRPIQFIQHPQNRGSLHAFHTAITNSTGKLIHLLHADDMIKPGYYKKMEALFQKHPDAGAAYCAWNYIDEHNRLLRRSRTEAQQDGILEDWLRKLALHQRLQYVCITVKREVYERLGSFFGVTYGEDWEMWARIAKHYPVAYTPDILAEYREHTSSISSQSFLTGKNIRDVAKVIDVITTYLPPDERANSHLLARKYYVEWAFDEVHLAWYKQRNRQAVFAQIKAMLELYRSPSLLKKMLLLAAQVQLSPIKHSLKKLRYKNKLQD